MVPLNRKMRPPGHIGLLMPVNQRIQKGLIILIIKENWIGALEWKQKVVYLEWREDHWHLSMLSCPVTNQWQSAAIQYGHNHSKIQGVHVKMSESPNWARIYYYLSYLLRAALDLTVSPRNSYLGALTFSVMVFGDVACGK